MTTSTLSIIIPTLNEGKRITALLECLKSFGAPLEIIVVDGGSQDDTVKYARNAGAIVVSSPKGRGIQLHHGTQYATGDTFWFLHADIIPSKHCLTAIHQALEESNTVGGNFHIRFDDNSAASRFLTWFYAQIRFIGLCYGDSAFFVKRDAYEAIGGFRPYPIFEDLDLVQRLRKIGRFVRLRSYVRASSRRYKQRLFAIVFARWCYLQVLYWLGVSPFRLGQMYYKPSKATYLVD